MDRKEADKIVKEAAKEELNSNGEAFMLPKGFSEAEELIQWELFRDYYLKIKKELEKE